MENASLIRFRLVHKMQSASNYDYYYICYCCYRQINEQTKNHTQFQPKKEREHNKVIIRLCPFSSLERPDGSGVGQLVS